MTQLPNGSPPHGSKHAVPEAALHCSAGGHAQDAAPPLHCVVPTRAPQLQGTPSRHPSGAPPFPALAILPALPAELAPPKLLAPPNAEGAPPLAIGSGSAPPCPAVSPTPPSAPSPDVPAPPVAPVRPPFAALPPEAMPADAAAPPLPLEWPLLVVLPQPAPVSTAKLAAATIVARTALLAPNFPILAP